MLWTAEAIENLKRLALEGRSASVIAAALGAASRNAVIGKANRIGIKLNGGGGAYTPSGMPAGPYPAPLAANPRPAPVFRKRGSSAAASYELENSGHGCLAKPKLGRCGA